MRGSICFTLIALLTLPSLANAGAWTKPKGDLELIASTLYFTSDAFWDLNGTKISQDDFNKYEINPYAEYGLSDKLTLGANLFLHIVEQEGSSPQARDNFGLGDSEFFARYQLWRNDTSVLSIQPLVKLPSLYEKEGVPRSGSDVFDGELSLLAGHSFNWFGNHHYAEARAGYRHRFGDELEDQLRLDAKLGLRLNETWEIIPAIYSIWAINPQDQQRFTRDGQQDFDLIKLETMVRYNIAQDWYLQGGSFAHVYGRNVGNGIGAVLSAGFTF